MSERGLVIRKAVLQDVDTIVRIVNAGGPDGPRQTLPNVLPTDYFSAFETIDQDPHQLLMVVEKEATVIATFHLSFLTYLAAAGQPDMQIEAVHVVASHRRLGIGTLMLEWAIEEARKRNCRRVQLTTDKRRTEAHPIYRKLGFVFSHEGAKLVF